MVSELYEARNGACYEPRTVSILVRGSYDCTSLVNVKRAFLLVEGAVIEIDTAAQYRTAVQSQAF